MLGGHAARRLLAPEDRAGAVGVLAAVGAHLGLGVGAAVAPVAERPLLGVAVGHVLELAAAGLVVHAGRVDLGPDAALFDLGGVLDAARGEAQQQGGERERFH